ncbi:MAG: peptidylprolyl isomerase [Ardenticatenaceae bacterium]|nr:peptidylprolyl isomerase [Ardenticatenaceae bacterium]
MVIDQDKNYTATIKTNKGGITIDLFANDAPKTVNNFVFLARDGFYDGVTFHRVIPGFVAQGGDPTGTGRGGPGYTFADEVKNNPHKHVTGVLSMANAGPNTNGSQFFIVYEAQPHLNGKHTVFGQVTSGMDVARTLENGDVMKTVEIHED